MKVSKLVFNGNIINIDDKSALQLPDGVEMQDGDVLVYNEHDQAFEYVNKDDLVEKENGIIPNSQKVAKSGDVYTAIQKAVNHFNECYLDISYDSSTSKILITPEQGKSIETDLRILVMTINTNYNSQTEELKFSNIVDIITINEASQSAEKYISPYSEDRVFYFLLVNNAPSLQICYLNIDSILIPGINEKTNVTLSAALSTVGGVQVINITSSVNVDVDVDVNLRFIDSNNNTTTETIKLIAGSSTQTKQISMSGAARTCYLTCVPTAVSELQNYIMQTTELAIPAGLGSVEIIPEADSNNPQVIFSTYGNQPVYADIDIKLVLPRNGVPPIILTGKILTGQSSGSISYIGQAFTGNVVGCELGANKVDDRNQYFMITQQVQLIVNPQ